MKTVDVVTTNALKFGHAQKAFAEHGLQVRQVAIEVDEIQSEDAELVVRRKAEAAFATHGSPVVVSDDSWLFEGLNGFPGAYMHSMNEWLTPEDFIRLCAPLTNRKVTLRQYIAYYDGTTMQVLSNDLEGVVLHEPAGTPIPRHGVLEVVSFDHENKKSVAEMHEEHQGQPFGDASEVWRRLAETLKASGLLATETD
jgi:inosine/xanthosine triphosphate pyrophosphatase family protein